MRDKTAITSQMKSNYSRYMLFGIIILIALFIVVRQNQWITINNKFINRIKVNKKSILIELKDKRYLNKLIDLSIFNGHEPVGSFSEAISKYGEPSNSVSEKGHDEKIEYWYKNARIEYIREETANEEISYTLCSYPFNKSINDIILDSTTHKYFESITGQATITVKLRRFPLLMVIVVHGNRVDKIYW